MGVFWIILITFCFTKDILSDSTINFVLLRNEDAQIQQTADLAIQDFINVTQINVMCKTITIKITEENVNKKITKEINDALSTTTVNFLLDTTMFNSIINNYTKAAGTFSLPKVYILCENPEKNTQPATDPQAALILNENEQNIGNLITDLMEIFNLSSAALLVDNIFDEMISRNNLFQGVPVRHMVIPITDSKEVLSSELQKAKSSHIRNYFIVGSNDNIEDIIEIAKENGMMNTKFSWFILTKNYLNPVISFEDCSVLLFKPYSTTENINSKISDDKLESDYVFLYELMLLLLKTALKGQQQLTTEAESFKTILEKMLQDWENAGSFSTEVDQENIFHVSPTTEVLLLQNNSNKYEETKIGVWSNSEAFTEKLENITVINGFQSPLPIYEIVTVHQPPFVYKIDEPNGGTRFEGYCIDVIESMKTVFDFEYNIYEAPNSTVDDPEQMSWTGLLQEIVTKRADIGVGPIMVTTASEEFVDFTLPFYDLVGMQILMKKSITEFNLFKFLSVLDPYVWLTIFGSFLLTSIFLWLIDYVSPTGSQKGIQTSNNDEPIRIFTLKESLWFCITSLTSQGGGESPKNSSTRLVAVSWWLFCFILTASYTANLAAFLTVSRLDNQIGSIDDLARQYTITYSTVNNSEAMVYFRRMALIEQKFFDKWKEMTISNGQKNYEHNQYSVWDYPIGDKYSKIWQSMDDTGFVPSFEEGILKIRDDSRGFALIAQSTNIKYATMLACDLLPVGEEFSLRPLGFAVQKGSILKETLSMAILELQNKRQLEILKEKWWTNNPNSIKCPEEDVSSDQIDIENLGGVFILILVGLFTSWLILAFELYFNQRKRPKDTAIKTVELSKMATTRGILNKTGTPPTWKEKHYYYTS